MKHCLFFILFLFCHITVYAQTIIPPVTFYPDKTIHLDSKDSYFHRAINDYILHSLKAEGLLLSIMPLVNKAHYYLKLSHGVGCPDLGKNEACNIMVTWDLFRGDHAPVMSWQAYYKINIPLPYHASHFDGYRLPEKIIHLIGDEFIKSIIYETLKKQKHDYVHIMPDRLEDQTTLCSADTVFDSYAKAGLYVTDKAQEARFLIKTDIKISEYAQDTATLLVRRIILDRVTGNYKIFPVKSVVEKDFLFHDSYDCKQSAAITIQNIGLFIDNAP